MPLTVALPKLVPDIAEPTIDMPESYSSQRNLIVAIFAAALVITVLVMVDLAVGGRPDPADLRAAATVLNGPWRFHIGDDPRWSDVGIDDSNWETIDLTAPPGSHDGDVGLPDYVGGWMAHGHQGYAGYAWYRRAVDVPTGQTTWDILGPTLVEDGYELYWNGQLLGGSGRLSPPPRVVGTRPRRFVLPAAAGTRGVIAVRVFMLSRSAPSADGGGIHSAPMLAPRRIGDALHRAQWQRTVAGYIVDAVEPLAMFALIALAVSYRRRSSHQNFLIFLCIALALSAARRLTNAIGAWTDVLDLPTYSWLATVMWIPTVAFWAMAWNRWSGRPWRGVDVLATALAVAELFGALAPSGGVTKWSRLASIALFVVIGVRIARTGPRRILALGAMASVIAVTFGGELLDPIGVPGIWFPFGIGVSRSQYIYALVIPLVALLIVRTLPSDDEQPSRSGDESTAPELSYG